MTVAPETLDTKPEKSSGNEFSVLEHLFVLGYTESEPVTIFKDGTNEIIAKFRTLTPPELREVLETCGQYSTTAAQIITERLETLARAIISINHMPLILPMNEREKFFEENRKSPSPLEMARVILLDKIKSVHIIDALYEAYLKFTEDVAKNFEDIKKKLNNPAS